MNTKILPIYYKCQTLNIPIDKLIKAGHPLFSACHNILHIYVALLSKPQNSGVRKSHISGPFTGLT